jgi:hypothetical protein
MGAPMKILDEVAIAAVADAGYRFGDAVVQLAARTGAPPLVAVVGAIGAACAMVSDQVDEGAAPADDAWQYLLMLLRAAAEEVGLPVPAEAS